MNHWILVPIILPSLAAPLIVLAARQDIVLQRCFSISSTAGMLAVSLFLLGQAISGPPQLYELGNWPSPFGIVMVLDRLSAMMVTLTPLLALLAVRHSGGTPGWYRRTLPVPAGLAGPSHRRPFNFFVFSRCC